MFIVFGNGFFKIPAVGRISMSNSEKAAFFVHIIVHFIRSIPFVFHYKCNNCGINRTAASSHFDSVKRSKSHRCVDAFSSLNRGNRSSVSDVTGNYFRFFCGYIKKFDHLFRNKAVRCAVCAVTAYFVFFGYFRGNRIGICFFRHCLMKSRIKYKNLRNIRHYSAASVESHKMSGRVKRSERVAELKLINYIICNEATFKKVRTTVDNTVSYRFYFAHV